jgi:hypothetical protein
VSDEASEGGTAVDSAFGQLRFTNTRAGETGQATTQTEGANMNLDKLRALAQAVIDNQVARRMPSNGADQEVKLARACLALCDVADVASTGNRAPKALASIASVLEELGL